MARIRTIKPEFWTDERIVELSPLARLLFIGLWNFADDAGRMVCSPKRIKMQIFPSDPADIPRLLGELRGESMIVVYSVDNVEYLQVTNFEKHQKVDKRSPSKFPGPPESPRIPPTEWNGMEEKKLSSRAKKAGIGEDGPNSFTLPPWLPLDAWASYLEMRRKIRKPATARAMQLAVSVLDKLRAEGNDPLKVLEQSTFHSWQGLFPLKGGPSDDDGGVAL